MKLRLLRIVVATSVAITWGVLFAFGYHEGDKRAACWHSDLESFEFQEIPAPETEPFPKGPGIEKGNPL